MVTAVPRQQAIHNVFWGGSEAKLPSLLTGPKVRAMHFCRLCVPCSTCHDSHALDCGLYSRHPRRSESWRPSWLRLKRGVYCNRRLAPWKIPRPLIALSISWRATPPCSARNSLKTSHGYAVNRGVAVIDTMERRVDVSKSLMKPHRNIDQLVLGSKIDHEKWMFFFFKVLNDFLTCFPLDKNKKSFSGKIQGRFMQHLSKLSKSSRVERTWIFVSRVSWWPHDESTFWCCWGWKF